jgi:hypothetical protein
MKKNIVRLIVLTCSFGLLFSCASKKEMLEVSIDEKEIFNSSDEHAVKISNEETEYEIIIIEPGFYAWLNSIARPEGYYSKEWLENRNHLLVINWNQRVLQPQQFDPNLYMLQIDYDPQIDYGYDVNWKLYNYFIYFQRKYNQRLGPWLPRI